MLVSSLNLEPVQGVMESWAAYWRHVPVNHGDILIALRGQLICSSQSKHAGSHNDDSVGLFYHHAGRPVGEIRLSVTECGQNTLRMHSPRTNESPVRD